MTEDPRVVLRAEAEARVRARESKEAELDRGPEEGDAKAVVHELRVHQVELEMQNEELRRAQVALELARSRYRDLYDNAPVGYLTLDGEGAVLKANLQAAELLGTPRGELVGRRLSSFVFPEDQDAYYLRRRALQKEGTPQSFELRLARPDGLERWCLVETSAVTDAEDGTVGRVVLTNITQRKAEAALATAQKLQAIGLLAAGIAHDFNNVLTAVHGNLSLLDLQLTGDELSRELLSEAKAACAAANGLARQLLTFSIGGEPVVATADLRSLVSSAARFAVRGSAVQYVFELGDKPLLVRVDADQIALVTQNLVLNAVQVMPGGGAIVFRADEVEVSRTTHPGLQAGRFVRLTVQDQGPGIAEADLSRVFEPYFSSKARGRGLGLATARSVMRRHHGDIEVASPVGAGARFTLYFPVAPPEAVAAAPVPTRSAHRGGRVLIMDDDDLVAGALKRLLGSLGYESGRARDGVEALQLWREAMSSGAPFVLVIMDLTIPGGMGGEEAIRELLKLDPKAKAVVASGYSGDRVMSEWAAHGFKGALKKPFTRGDVSAVVGGALAAGVTA